MKWLISFLAMLSPGALFAGCGDAPEACEIDSGSYHAVLPADPEGAPVVIWLHGAGSHGGAAIGNKALVQGFTERGYVVLAPTGFRSFGGAKGRSWNFYPGWEGRDETVFLRDVLSDAGARFGLDTGRSLLSGFSAGGFMVTYLACQTPELFSAYAPVAGGFWRPHPQDCAGPVKLLHSHGWRDKTVPLEGRSLGGGRFQQGDIFEGMQLFRAANACVDEKPDSFPEGGTYLRRRWDNCAPGSALEMALFPGGHTVPADWPALAVDWFEGLEE